MLKRQRASSPILPSSSIPQDTSSEGIIDIRDLKRRRVAPPLLDGRSRNGLWGIGTAEEKHEEEEYPEEEVQSGGNEAEFPQPSFEIGSGEYAAMNSVLKEIHILHKHRQTFSEPVPSLPHASLHYPTHSEADKYQSLHHPERQTSEESARVYEHYEGTNKSLASAFLSRRQRYADQS